MNRLSRDDWELTLGQLKSQQVSMLLQLAVIDAGVESIEKRLKGMPKKVEDVKKEEGKPPVGVG